MRFFIFFLTSVLLFSYDLIVTSKKDMNKLSEIGFVCQPKNSIYVCLSSNDLNELKRIKDFLKNKFNIKVQILQEESKPKNIVISKKISNENKKFNNNLELKKTGYCIQVGSFRDLRNAKIEFLHYKNFPFTRVEKIGSFFTVRVGEGDYNDIKELNNQLNGVIKKCDLIPQRIVISNFTNNEFSSIKVKIKRQVVNNTNVDNANIKAMYYYLNNGDLVKAKEEALKLKNIYPDDANLVLGIIAMKNQNFQKACNIFSSLNSPKVYKLKKDACFTYYLKKGFLVINDAPKKALYYFNKALKYKKDVNALMGKGYAYLNNGDYEKAYNIFKSLYKQYPNNEKIVEGYVNTLYLLKKFDELERLKASLPLKLQKKLSSLDFYVKLKKAQELMKNKEYKKAEKILSNLYLQKPDDINVLLSLGNLYLQTNQLDKALNFYNNVLVISPDNIYALKALEAIYLKRGDYKKALEYSNKITSLGFKDENKAQIEKFYYLSLAKEYLAKNKIDLAKKYLKKAQTISPNDPLVLSMLGDLAYKEKNNNLAYMYYAKAYSLAKNNFGITLKFLYALLNLNLYDQIKLVLNTIDTNTLTDIQREKLRKFYIDLYAKYSSYLLNNGEYQKALEVVNDGLLMDSNNPNLLSTKAWICLKLKKYECAKKYFELALNKKNDNNLKYGLALVYMNLGNKDKAKKILDSIHTNDKSLRVKIAGAYVRLGEIEKAKAILNGINPTEELKEPVINKTNKINEPVNKGDFFPNPFLKNIPKKENKTFLGEKIDKYPVKKKIVLKSIAKEYEEVKKEIENIEQNYISNLKIGVKLRNKSGGDGTSKLKRVSFPYIKGEYFTKKHNKLVFIINGDYLYSGKSKTDLKNSTTGIALKVGYENKNFKIYIGSTPLGTNLVAPTLIGSLAFKIKKELNTYYLSIYRKSVKDTLTSYVGNIHNNTKFGRVVKNGAKFGYKRDLDSNGSFLYTNLAFNYLNGKNISSNTNIEGEVLYLYNIGSYLLDKDMLGFYTNISHYSKNSYKFYSPYGGYFSPKVFFLFMPRYEGYFYSKDKKFISKLIVMLGGSYLDNWDYSKIDFSYDIGYSLKYLLFNKLALEGGMDYRNSKDYNDFFLTLMLRYYFGDKKYFSEKDIDNFSKKVINW